MDLSRLSQGEKIVLIAGGLLLIDLLFLPWYDFDLGLVSFTRSAIESPKAIWGVLAALVTAAMVAAVVVTRFTTARMPALPLGQAMFVAGVTVAGLLLLKLLLATDFLGTGAWLGVLLGGAVAYGGFLMRDESQGAPPPAAF